MSQLLLCLWASGRLEGTRHGGMAEAERGPSCRALLVSRNLPCDGL